jgi:hypothetical protein
LLIFELILKSRPSKFKIVNQTNLRTTLSTRFEFQHFSFQNFNFTHQPSFSAPPCDLCARGSTHLPFNQ